MKNKVSRPGQDDWKSRRLMYQPPRRTPEIPEPPKWEDFPSERTWTDALDQWLGSYYGTSDRSRTVTHPDDARDQHVVGVVPTTQSQAEFAAAVEASRDQRLLQGSATLADRASYYNQHGTTPDGRHVSVDEEAYLRGYQARISGTTPDEE